MQVRDEHHNWSLIAVLRFVRIVFNVFDPSLPSIVYHSYLATILAIFRYSSQFSHSEIGSCNQSPWRPLNNMELNDFKFQVQDMVSIWCWRILATPPQMDMLLLLKLKWRIWESSVKWWLIHKQIDVVCVKAKNVISWIQHTFKTRCHTAMMMLYKSLVIQLLEYCSVLWSPLWSRSNPETGNDAMFVPMKVHFSLKELMGLPEKQQDIHASTTQGQV